MKNFSKFFVTIFLILSFVSASEISAQEYTAKLEKLKSLADSVTNYYRQNMDVKQGGFYIYINTPDETYLVYSGLNQDITPLSNLRLASITKTFTAASIMKLYDEGLLDIADVITNKIPGTDKSYVPDDENYDLPFKNKITIEMLLGHRAGVFDVTNTAIPDSIKEPYAGISYPMYIMETLKDSLHTFDFDELTGIVAKNKLYYFEPGEGFHYSNTGYHILGKIIERVSGLTYSEFIEKNFLDPLDIKAYSIWKGTDTQIPEPNIQSYFQIDGNSINTTIDNMSPNVADGNIISSPEEISKWMRFLITGKAGVSPKSIEKMIQMKPGDKVQNLYGLGLTVNQGLGYGHDGAHNAYLNVLRHNPENGVTVFAACNFWYIKDLYTQGYSLNKFALDAVNIVTGK